VAVPDSAYDQCFTMLTSAFTSLVPYIALQACFGQHGSWGCRVTLSASGFCRPGVPCCL